MEYIVIDREWLKHNKVVFYWKNLTYNWELYEVYSTGKGFWKEFSTNTNYDNWTDENSRYITPVDFNTYFKYWTKLGKII